MDTDADASATSGNGNDTDVGEHNPLTGHHFPTAPASVPLSPGTGRGACGTDTFVRSVTSTSSTGSVEAVLRDHLTKDSRCKKIMDKGKHKIPTFDGYKKKFARFLVDVAVLEIEAKKDGFTKEEDRRDLLMGCLSQKIQNLVSELRPSRHS